VRRLSFEYVYTVATFQHFILFAVSGIDAHLCFLFRSKTMRCLVFFRPIDSTMSDTLHRVFSAFGPIVEAAVIYDKHTKRSKGYGMHRFALSTVSLFELCVVCGFPAHLQNRPRHIYCIHV
jgi:hypothetical protein